jgi:hypothetical protein
MVYIDSVTRNYNRWILNFNILTAKPEPEQDL